MAVCYVEVLLIEQSRRRPWLRQAAPLLLGIALFAVNEAPVLNGYLSPPPGYVASFLPQNEDVLLYQTWINAYQGTKGWLIPNYHAPWATEPALMDPYFWLIGRTSAAFGVDNLWIYHLSYLALTIAGGYALFFTLRAFTSSGTEARLALLFSFCCVPVFSVLALATFLVNRSNPLLDHILAASKDHEDYNSDGFVNGVGGSPLVLFGTVATLLCMGLLAKYLKTNLPKYLWWAGLVAGVGAFVHPFEIFVLMGAGGLALVMRRDRPWVQSIRETACLVLPGLVGLAPYLYLASRHAWLREAAVQNRWAAPAPLVLVLILGFPAVFCLLSYFLPTGKRSVTDPLLHCWFGSVLVGIYVPWIPWSHHLIDGVYYAIGLLLVRQLARCDFMRRLWIDHPAPVRVSIGALLVLSLAAHAVFLANATTAARVPGGASSTVMSKTDRAVVAWLRAHAGANDLVLAPKSQASLCATVPMHSFASHWLFGLTSVEQQRLSDAFYQGPFDRRAADALLARFGVGYAVIPDGSPAALYFAGRATAVRIESVAIYRIPEGRLRPFIALDRRP